MKDEAETLRRQAEMQKEQQLQQQMKQRLENLPRFGHKRIAFFEEKTVMQRAIDELMNNNIVNLSSKTLTENFIQEVYDMYIFMPKEGTYTLTAAIAGGLLGAIAGVLHGKGRITLPFFSPISAGGSLVSTILGIGIGSILFSTFTAITMLYKPITKVNQGYGMLTIYSGIEDKQNIENYLKKYDPLNDPQG
ncbi:hypothetical protein GOM49_17240 [Clostridium bovifaecis]|uniref:DUF1269 domain-containing protein n=1 Tax=Clostridium bovifaecis TaxID=2184719 RepID=A0A6I6ESJ3_9CLOT|nr:hypothetical protein GOM49_17240 [Clostridium bovifaecis]